MFEQMMDTLRKTTVSTLKVQQQLMQQWAQLPALAAPSSGTDLAEQIRAYQKQVIVTLIDMLKKHRETLDAQYGLGIQALEEAFRVGEAKDPAEYMRRAEEFCKHSLDCIKAVTEDQMKGFQAASEKWLEVLSKGVHVGDG
jgi:hypothetical protein